MGMDIHLNIIDTNGNYVNREIYDGRNSEWFNNLQGQGWSSEYDELPTIAGIPELVPEEVRDHYENGHENGYFGFYYLTVADYKRWFEQIRPDVEAGWVTTYDKWRYEKKGILTEELYHNLPEGVVLGDWHFIEVVDKYNNDSWLYNYLLNKKIDDECYISYYFDW